MATRLKTPANAETVGDVLADMDKRAADYDAWRPALIAFYRADCWFQSADNLEKFKQPLTPQDKRLIEVLAKAFEQAPRRKLRIAA